MKRIAAVFDGLRFEKAKMASLVRFCKNLSAHLVGVFPESFLYHEYDFAELLGKNGMSAVKIRHAVAKENQKRTLARESFTEECKSVGMPCSVRHPEGITIDELVSESTFADLILVDKHERFSNSGKDLPSIFIRQLLSDARAPILLLGEGFETLKHVVLLYDGKPGSVYAIKLFCSLALITKDVFTEVLYVSDSVAEIPDREKITALVECHYPGASYTSISGPEKQTAIGYVRGLGAEVLTVAGAYGRGSLSRFFIPSIADGLIAECKCSLFIAHNH